MCTSMEYADNISTYLSSYSHLLQKNNLNHTAMSTHFILEKKAHLYLIVTQYQQIPWVWESDSVSGYKKLN